ncbi:MAG: DUF5696 domain-containing protein, partial [Acholeplasmataceae bacterium]
FFTSSVYLTYAISNPNHSLTYNDSLGIVDNYPYITEQLLKSSRYTQKDEDNQDIIDNYQDNYVPDFTKEELELIDFNLVLFNDNFELYLNPYSFAVMLRNKTTNYLWSSINLFFQTGDSNRKNRSHGNSGLMIDFVRTANVMSSTISTESILSFADARYLTESDTIPEKLLPYAIDIDNIESKHNKVIIDLDIDNSNDIVKAQFNLKDYGFNFEVNLVLTNTGFDVFIPKDKILETDDRYRILNIHVFPNLGSTKEDNVPGYFVIPDGIGALVRLNKQYNANFNARFYGNDPGYNQNYIPSLSLPIFGIVHLSGENAFYAVVNEGAEHSNLTANFWGLNTKYNKMYPRYSIRNIYRTVISKAGEGRDAILEEKLSSNLNISYNFLSNEEANYVGIAKSYQEKLVNNDILSQKEIVIGNQIPLLTSYILSEQENSFIGTNKITMTSLNNLEKIYNSFKDNNINNQVINLYGWSNNGFVDRAPYQMKLVESEKNFKKIISLIHEDNNLIYLSQDYKIASSFSKRVNYFNDVAYRISRVRMSYERTDINNEKYNIFYLKPSVSLKMAKNDLNYLNKLDFDGFSLSDIGNNPFSYNSSNHYYDRSNTIETYQEITSLLSNNALVSPSEYLFKNMNLYLDMEISNSQFDYYTDLVPLIPIVLKGYVSYFSSYLNFNALGRDKLLSLIDFGINPSYVLTHEDTYKLRYTKANSFYTTSYFDFKDDVIDDYTYINNALKHVIDESIINREVIDLGVVLITYSNNVKILINYSNKPFSYLSKTINGQDYEVFL